ncbi:uncharacterized protein TNCV_3031881 [Trichonephila clavipes]|nr:uncharacterized protein TNCV_3031881 [Trichonephila clavipes]
MGNSKPYIAMWAVGSLVVRASDSRPEGLGGDRGRVAIYRPFGEVSLSLNRTATCMVLKANDRRTSCPCHDEFRGPRSDYVRQDSAAVFTGDISEGLHIFNSNQTQSPVFKNTGAIESSRNVTARVIERDTSGEIYYFLEDSRGFRTHQHGRQ